MLGNLNFHAFLHCLLFPFKITCFKRFSQEYHQSVKQLGCGSCPKFCQVWSVSKLQITPAQQLGYNIPIGKWIQHRNYSSGARVVL